MPTLNINEARRDAHSFCTKAECGIVQKSRPEELRELTPAQIRSQIKLSERYLNKHRENYKQMGGGHKKSPEAIGEQHHIKLKMSLMEDARQRFEKRLKDTEKKQTKVRAKAKASRSKLKGRSSATRASRLNA